MRQYFIHNGIEQEGPLSLEELKFTNLNKDSPIWYEGLSDWTTARELKELKGLFKIAPPPLIKKEPKPTPTLALNPITKEPIQKPNASTKLFVPKKKQTGRNIVLTLIGIGIIVGVITLFNEIRVGNGSHYQGANSSSYQQDKMSIEEKEQAYPTDFLIADGTYRENFLGDKLKVNGTIENFATVATFKDATVRITYYSKSRTDLGSEDYVIWDIFKPHSTKKFQLKIKNYSNVHSIGWEVVDASIVY